MPAPPDDHEAFLERITDTPADIRIDPAALPENVALMRELQEQIAKAPAELEYTMVVEHQAGAHQRLRDLGALDEIEIAVVSAAYGTAYAASAAAGEEPAPAPQYRPQLIKRLLGKCGWSPEVRVPPFDPRHDALPVNDRYDVFKVFEDAGERVGVAIEIQRWEVWNDLLKFRRGLQRGQIGVGVLIHDNPAHLRYVFDHLRLMSEPLFGHIPILFTAPAGPGLPDSYSPTSKKFRPYPNLRSS